MPESKEATQLYVLSSLILDVTWKVLSKTLSNVCSRLNTTFEQLLTLRQHSFYHLWQQERLCCQCDEKPEVNNNNNSVVHFRDSDWNRLYQQYKRTCHTDKGGCSCCYRALPGIQPKSIDYALATSVLITLNSLRDNEFVYLTKLRNHETELKQMQEKRMVTLDSKTRFPERWREILTTLEKLANENGNGYWDSLKEVQKLTIFMEKNGDWLDTEDIHLVEDISPKDDQESNRADSACYIMSEHEDDLAIPHDWKVKEKNDDADSGCPDNASFVSPRDFPDDTHSAHRMDRWEPIPEESPCLYNDEMSHQMNRKLVEENRYGLYINQLKAQTQHLNRRIENNRKDMDEIRRTLDRPAIYTPSDCLMRPSQLPNYQSYRPPIPTFNTHTNFGSKHERPTAPSDEDEHKRINAGLLDNFHDKVPHAENRHSTIPLAKRLKSDSNRRNFTLSTKATDIDSSYPGHNKAPLTNTEFNKLMQASYQCLMKSATALKTTSPLDVERKFFDTSCAKEYVRWLDARFCDNSEVENDLIVHSSDFEQKKDNKQGEVEICTSESHVRTPPSRNEDVNEGVGSPQTRTDFLKWIDDSAKFMPRHVKTDESKNRVRFNQEMPSYKNAPVNGLRQPLYSSLDDEKNGQEQSHYHRCMERCEAILQRNQNMRHQLQRSRQKLQTIKDRTDLLMEIKDFDKMTDIDTEEASSFEHTILSDTTRYSPRHITEKTSPSREVKTFQSRSSTTYKPVQLEAKPLKNSYVDKYDAWLTDSVKRVKENDIYFGKSQRVSITVGFSSEERKENSSPLSFPDIMAIEADAMLESPCPDRPEYLMRNNIFDETTCSRSYDNEFLYKTKVLTEEESYGTFLSESKESLRAMQEKGLETRMDIERLRSHIQNSIYF